MKCTEGRIRLRPSGPFLTDLLLRRPLRADSSLLFRFTLLPRHQFLPSFGSCRSGELVANGPCLPTDGNREEWCCLLSATMDSLTASVCLAVLRSQTDHFRFAVGTRKRRRIPCSTARHCLPLLRRRDGPSCRRSPVPRPPTCPSGVPGPRSFRETVRHRGPSGRRSDTDSHRTGPRTDVYGGVGGRRPDPRPCLM